MGHIEFDATVESEGLIRVPTEYAGELPKGEVVHVTARTKSSERRTVKRMSEQPILAPGFHPLTREEIHDRRM
jgi:hypothetical protein